MMDDLISRQAAIDAVHKDYDTILDFKSDGHTVAGSFEDIINALPSVQPEIIRCKDCKHKYVEDMIWHCPFGLMGGENFFCGYGSLGTVERRRDG